MRRAVFVGMVGKITKLAAGVMMTHFHRSKVDTDLLAEVARAGRAAEAAPPRRPPGTSSRCASPKACSNPYRNCAVGRPPTARSRRRALEVEVHLVDFDGEQDCPQRGARSRSTPTRQEEQ